MIAGPYYDVTCDDCGVKIRVQAIRLCVKDGWNVIRNNRKKTVHVRCPACISKLGAWEAEDGLVQE